MAGDALTGEQTLDAIDVPYPLPLQHQAFAADGRCADGPPAPGTEAPPSIALVFARRCRRGTAIDAGSTTWLSMPFVSSNRCPRSRRGQPPDDGNSDRSARDIFCRRPQACQRPTNALPSPPANECFDIFSLPGDSDVTNQVAWLNSSDAYSVASWC
jgi:hypothetical protein